MNDRDVVHRTNGDTTRNKTLLFLPPTGFVFKRLFEFLKLIQIKFSGAPKRECLACDIGHDYPPQQSQIRLVSRGPVSP